MRMHDNITPAISVIMPAYNHDRFVAQAITSVLEQKGVAFELLVIDDGSTDKTGEIAGELSRKHNFRFVSRPNKGVIPTIQEALSIAKGEFVSFVASDDYYLPDRLRAAVVTFRSEALGVQAIAGRAVVVNTEGKVLNNFESFLPEPLMPRDLYAELLVVNWIPALAVTYRTAFLRSLSFPHGLRMEDWLMLLSAAKLGALRVNQQRLSVYRKHQGNSIRNWGSALYQQQITLLAGQFPEMKSYLDLKAAVRSRQLSKVGKLYFYLRPVIGALARRRLKGLFCRKAEEHQ